MTPQYSLQIQKQLELLIDEVQDYAIFLLDPDGYIQTWNAGAGRIKGYAAEEIIGEHFSKFYTEEDLASGKPQSGLRIAAETGRFEDEGWRVRKDGSLFWANVVITALKTDAGSVYAYGKVTRDLTNRKWGEEEKFAKVFAAVPVALAISTVDEGRYIEVNEGFERFVGRPRSEIIGRTSTELELWPDKGMRTAFVERLRQEGPLHHMESTFRNRHGQQSVGVLSAALIRMGGHDCILSAFQDVTSWKKMEQTVRQLSTPVLSVEEGVLILPLIGTVDQDRASQMTAQLLQKIRQERARGAVVDLTGVASIDLAVANRIIQTVSAARLLGCEVILTGISTAIATALVDSGIDLSNIATMVDLRSGIQAAARRISMKVANGTAHD